MVEKSMFEVTAQGSYSPVNYNNAAKVDRLCKELEDISAKGAAILAFRLARQVEEWHLGPAERAEIVVTCAKAVLRAWDQREGNNLGPKALGSYAEFGLDLANSRKGVTVPTPLVGYNEASELVRNLELLAGRIASSNSEALNLRLPESDRKAWYESAVILCKFAEKLSQITAANMLTDARF